MAVRIGVSVTTTGIEISWPLGLSKKASPTGKSKESMASRKIRVARAVKKAKRA